MGNKYRHYRFAFFVALRYFFSKKQQNAINIISFVATCGVCLGTLALVCVLSVFNGFDSLVKEMFASFDPDLKIEATRGKVFSISDQRFEQIRSMDNVLVFSQTLEDNALIAYRNRQTPATIKGVDKNFKQLVGIDSILCEGNFLPHDNLYNYGVIGAGLASQLNIGIKLSDALRVFVPKRSQRINIAMPEGAFNQQNIAVSGVFSNQQDYDLKYLLVDLELSQMLFERDQTEVSAVELRVAKGQERATQRTIRNLLGDDFTVKNRYEQHEESFQIMQIEKWITFLILSLILLIATFNIVGSLSMLIIDKKEDATILNNLGASPRLIRTIFLFEGWLISFLGAIVGLGLGLIICLGQQHFGWLKMGEGFFVENYPVILQFSDFVLIFFTVIGLGFLASYYPIRFLQKKD